VANGDLDRLRLDRTGAGRPVRRRRRWMWAALAAALAAGGGAWLAVGYRSAIPVETTPVVSAWPSQGYTLLNATGYVVAQRKAAVASKATGRLEWLGVREGSVVKGGEVIARLESRDVTAQMEQAQASVRLARANLEQGRAELTDAEAQFARSRDLVARGFVSAAVHDAAIARLARARASVSALEASIGVAEAAHRAAQVAVDQTLIRAPFDGVVLTKTANVGDVITPFSSALDTKGAVVTMADMQTLEVEADVSESNLARVRVDQPCEIQLDALPDVRLRGVVGRMVPTVDRAKATVVTKIRFVETDARVLPDMSAKVAFLSRSVSDGERGARAAVPATAIAKRDGADVVFVVNADRASLARVELGAPIGDLVEIVKGAKAGDKVVLKPPADLGDGALVKPAVK